MKYWGKRDDELNLPVTGSISLTLDSLSATACVSAGKSDGAPGFLQDGEPVSGVAAQRMATFLDAVASRFGAAGALQAEVSANFPVGAGLASSAAIYCAVAAAAVALLGQRVTREGLSAVARLGSGSATRSVFGGFVEWQRGERPDGLDSIARPLLSESAWDVGVAVAVVNAGRKSQASRDAMRHVHETSPLFGGWVEAQDCDLAAMRRAIASRDLDLAGRIAEENCLRMHATTLAARPPILYWAPATVAAMREVQAMREAGLRAYFTIDAGPQVKALCRGEDLETVARRLEALPGVERVIRARPGPGVAVLEGEEPWR